MDDRQCDEFVNIFINLFQLYFKYSRIRLDI